MPHISSLLSLSRRLLLLHNGAASCRSILTSSSHPWSASPPPSSSSPRSSFNVMAAMTGNDEDTHAPPTAGIIVIGDEILKGQTVDSNSSFIARRLNRLGVRVKKISVIPDDVDSISTEVRLFSQCYTHVVTSGGIGPTHDDVTYQAVADAFNDSVIAHPVMVSLVGRYFNTTDLGSPPMKMAHVPSKSELVYPEDRSAGYKSFYPVVKVNNVLLLPGVPSLLEKSFRMLDTQLFRGYKALPSSQLFLSIDEVSLAPSLNKTVKEFPDLNIGSYPHLYHSYYKTHVTIEGSNEDRVRLARQHFEGQLPAGSVLNDFVEDTTSEAWPRLQKLLEEHGSLRGPVEESIAILQECLQQYKAEEVCVCFNGGKDCLAVLHLYYCVLQHHYNSKNASDPSEVVAPKIQAVYITEDNTFPEITDFVKETINRYSLDCSIIPGPLRPALTRLSQDRPELKAVIMGTRRMDPYSNSLKHFQSTDTDWPSFMRVSAILAWDYDTVWRFIRGLYLPYCRLYDRGYTSLGNATNTVPNPALHTTDPFGNTRYLPAHLLRDGAKERSGRT